MKIAIITEGGKDIGFGHITRCLGLCSELEKKGAKVYFIINNDVHAAEKIREKKFKAYKGYKEIFELVKGSDCAVVDSYLLTQDVYSGIRDLVRLLVCIDDNKRMEYPADIVINGAVYAKDMGFSASGNTDYLLGTEFMPVRQEFVNINNGRIKKDIENILISFGGSDFKGMTGKVKDFTAKVFPRAAINAIGGDRDVKDVLRLMQESDVAISAGGQTLHELARVGIPTLGVCVARNQLNNLKGWEEKGFLRFCGWYDSKDLLKKIEDALSYVKDKGVRQKMKNAGQSLVDGKGAQRSAEKIIGALN